MSDCTVKRIDEMEAIFGGAYKRARAELGVTAFGMQVIDFPPNFEGYPEHDHGSDGQEEVYFALGGGAEIEVDGERHPLDGETFVQGRTGHHPEDLAWRRRRAAADRRRSPRRRLRAARSLQARRARPDRELANGS